MLNLKKIELIEEILEEVKNVAWMLGINDTDLLALLLKIHAEGLSEEEILLELLNMEREVEYFGHKDKTKTSPFL